MKGLWGEAYTGPFGSRASDASYEGYDKGGRFFTKRGLNPGEGLTIVLGWDRGLIRPPSAWKKFFWKLDLRENWIFALPLASLPLMIRRWYRKGRDPRVREAIVVRYGPPEFDGQPLPPAEVGALVDEKLDPRDITSTIVGLATRGYLRIEEVKKEGWLFDSRDYYLKKLKPPDKGLSRFESELLRCLFPGELPGVTVSSLKNKFYTHLSFLKETLFNELIRKRYFVRNPTTATKFFSRQLKWNLLYL